MTFYILCSSIRNHEFLEIMGWISIILFATITHLNMDALISLVLCYYFSVVPCIVFKLFPPLNFLYRNLKLLLEIMSAASIMHLSLSLFCFWFSFFLGIKCHSCLCNLETWAFEQIFWVWRTLWYWQFVVIHQTFPLMYTLALICWSIKHCHYIYIYNGNNYTHDL